MKDISTIVEGYFAVWNETDASRRSDLINRTWDDDASYLDPMLTAEGRDGIDTMVTTVQEQFPDHQFRLVGSIDSYQDRVRFGWELVNLESDSAIVAGVDFGVIADDGRLRAITGFFDQAPALPDDS